MYIVAEISFLKGIKTRQKGDTTMRTPKKHSRKYWMQYHQVVKNWENANNSTNFIADPQEEVKRRWGIQWPWRIVSDAIIPRAKYPDPGERSQDPDEGDHNEVSRPIQKMYWKQDGYCLLFHKKAQNEVCQTCVVQELAGLRAKKLNWCGPMPRVMWKDNILQPQHWQMFRDGSTLLLLH